MSDETEEPRRPAPILYVTDLTYDTFDPADLFDLAYLLRSPDHELIGIGLTVATEEAQEEAIRVLDALSVRQGSDVPYLRGSEAIQEALRSAEEPINLVIVGGYSAVGDILSAEPALFRQSVARLFLVGGYANDYAQGLPAEERLPIDPRLRQRNPERFAVTGDPRVTRSEAERAAWAQLLTSGEGVIWLPRDICLWRYAAPGILEDGGPVCEFLLRELFYANLRDAGWESDRYEAADTPVLLSALPALLLAVRPDPFVWMRLFRAIAARVEADEASGALTGFTSTTDAPNLYTVVAIDGQALGKLLTARLRDRPLRG